MRRKFTVLGVLLLGMTLLLTTGLFEPLEAKPEPCWIETSSCQTTCTGPQGVECCCLYHCPSGDTWVCQQGTYCANTDRSCIWQ